MVDRRLYDQRVPIDGSVDKYKLLDGAVTSDKILDGTITSTELADNAVTNAKMADDSVGAAEIINLSITDAEVATANKDGVAGTASMRTLGTGAQQAASGTDARLSDTRTPTDGTVTVAKLSTGLQLIRTGTSSPSSPVEGQLWYDTDDNILLVYTGSVWVCITPVSSTVSASANHNTTSYTTLGAGPAVSLLTATTALVTLSCFMNPAAGGENMYASAAVSGATTSAAADSRALIQGINGGTGWGGRVSSHYLFTGLTAGSNTFTMRVRMGSANTGAFADRTISAVGIPE
jgi:hypothetical protein